MLISSKEYNKSYSFELTDNMITKPMSIKSYKYDKRGKKIKQKCTYYKNGNELTDY